MFSLISKIFNKKPIPRTVSDISLSSDDEDLMELVTYYYDKSNTLSMMFSFMVIESILYDRITHERITNCIEQVVQLKGQYTDYVTKKNVNVCVNRMYALLTYLETSMVFVAVPVVKLVKSLYTENDKWEIRNPDDGHWILANYRLDILLTVDQEIPDRVFNEVEVEILINLCNYLRARNSAAISEREKNKLLAKLSN